MKRGQGAFEYILLLAGVILVVVLVIFFLRGGFLRGQETQIQLGTCKSQIAVAPECKDLTTGNWVITNKLEGASLSDQCETLLKASADYCLISSSATGTVTTPITCNDVTKVVVCGPSPG